jgi:hypothetical protein
MKCMRDVQMEGTMCLSKQKKSIGISLLLRSHPKWLTVFQRAQYQLTLGKDGKLDGGEFIIDRTSAGKRLTTRWLN